MSSLLITDARIVNEGRVTEGDVLIGDGRIVAIGGDLSSRPAEQVLEADGRWLLPGLIDDQVHFREPGLEHKADIASESAAAVAGGITTFFEMPNTQPPTLDAAALEDKYARASGRARANFAFYFGAAHDNRKALEALDPRTTPGIKIFMGSSTGNMLVDDPDVLERIFRTATVPVVTHCEDTPTIEANAQALRERLGDAIEPRHHPQIRSHEACLTSSAFAVDLARQHGTNLHVLHLTTARELALFEPGPIADKRITCEVCIHHLSFDEADYAALGNRIKCNPAIKSAADRRALLAGLRDDRLDIIATDHAPHTAAEKDVPYLQAPAGLPLVQDSLPALLELVHQGELDIAQVVEKACHNPARRFDVAERGFIREGYWADLVLADPDTPTDVRDAAALSKCGWTPFAGRRLHGSVTATVVCGEIVWQDGALTGKIPGQRVAFVR
ncbi:MAG: dihydroorotase [Halofilum sp. (in: g-proteobacteria)]